MRGYLYRDLGECFYSPIQFKRVLDPAIVSAIIGAGASIASSAGSSIAAANLNATNRDFSREMTLKQNEFNAEQAALSREHQAGLLSQEQNWQEQMYNLYNSPSAMMRQYREAGMNPYMVDAQGVHGQSLGSPTAPSSPQASGSSVVSPSTYMPDLSGIGRAGEMLLQGISVSANSANQSAQSIHQVLENAVMMEKMDIPKESIQNYLYSSFKEIKGVNFDASRFVREYDLTIESQELANKRSRLAYELDSHYSPMERDAKLNEVDQLITESVSRIGMMASDAKVNEAKCEQIAQDIKESLSRIFKNVAEGSLADVKGLEIMTLLPYIEAGMSLDMDKKELLNEETYGNETLRKMNKTTLGRAFNVVLHYLNRIFDSGNVGVNVSGKLNK